MAKANAYSLFVFDTARKRRAQGINVNQASLFKELDSEWRNLPDHVKERYKERAKSSTNYTSSARFAERRESSAANQSSSKESIEDVKRNIKSEHELHTNAEPSITEEKANIADIKKELTKGVKRSREEEPVEEKETKKTKVYPGIPNWKNIKDKSQIEPVKYLQKNLYDLRVSCLNILRSRSDKILKIPIYTFSVNVLCKQKRGGEVTFVPLEICIYAYSIADGQIGEPYHVIIDSGPIPLGCLNAARDHASDNHKISIPNRVNETKGYPPSARTDYKQIYKEMLDYVKKGERTILIDSANYFPQVHGCLDWLYKKASEEPGMGIKLSKPSSWTVMPIVEFFASTANIIAQDLLKQPTLFFAYHYYLNMLKTKSDMDQNHNIMCDYHAIEENRSMWCAKSCASRLISNLSPAINEINRCYSDYKFHQQAIESSRQPQPITYPPNMQNLAMCHSNMMLQQPQSTLPTVNTHNAPLAIENNPIPVAPADPRLKGMVQPVIAPYSTIAVGEDVNLIVQPSLEPITLPKKKKEQLIIASTPAYSGNPRDVF